MPSLHTTQSPRFPCPPGATPHCSRPRPCERACAECVARREARGGCEEGDARGAHNHGSPHNAAPHHRCGAAVPLPLHGAHGRTAHGREGRSEARCSTARGVCSSSAAQRLMQELVHLRVSTIPCGAVLPGRVGTAPHGAAACCIHCMLTCTHQFTTHNVCDPWHVRGGMRGHGPGGGGYAVCQRHAAQTPHVGSGCGGGGACTPHASCMARHRRRRHSAVVAHCLSLTAVPYVTSSLTRWGRGGGVCA